MSFACHMRAPRFWHELTSTFRFVIKDPSVEWGVRLWILKNRRRVLLASLPQSSIGQKRIAGLVTQKLNREDYG
jgi:hypothetical protein